MSNEFNTQSGNKGNEKGGGIDRHDVILRSSNHCPIFFFCFSFYLSYTANITQYNNII